MLGIVTNLSLSGCYVETSGMLLPGTEAEVALLLDNINLSLQCEVVRMDMGMGAALKFHRADARDSRRCCSAFWNSWLVRKLHGKRRTPNPQRG